MFLTLLSVNLGRCRQLSVGGNLISTGFFKQPADSPIFVSSAGIEGDEISDRTRHGGDGQEIYLYSAEDAAWWAERLGEVIPPGYFGENLTIEHWWPEPRIGDRIVFPYVTLEIAFPRIPCATLAARVGRPAFLKEFVQAKRPGLYARVINEGLLSAPAQGQVFLAPPDNPTAVGLFEVWHMTPRDRAVMEAALAAPIAARARQVFEYWLAPGARDA